MNEPGLTTCCAYTAEEESPVAVAFSIL